MVHLEHKLCFLTWSNSNKHSHFQSRKRILQYKGLEIGKTFIVLIEPCWPAALDPTNLMSTYFDLLLIKLILFLGVKACFAPTKLH